ncbi:Hypothetical protein FKW44_002353, partial [Caligus rogercresseyi]
LQTEVTVGSGPPHSGEEVNIDNSNNIPLIVEITDDAQSNIIEPNLNELNNTIENNIENDMISSETNTDLPLSTEEATELMIEPPGPPVEQELIVEKDAHEISQIKLRKHISTQTLFYLQDQGQDRCQNEIPRTPDSRLKRVRPL